MKPRIALFLFSILVILVGCDKKQQIPEKKMIDIMYDMYLSNAVAAENQSHNGNIVPEEVVRLRQQEVVLNKHKVKQEDYDSTLAWYGRNLKAYITLCDKVEKRLTTDKEQLANHVAVEDSMLKLASGPTDTLLLLPMRRATSFELMLAHNFSLNAAPGAYFAAGDTIELSMYVAEFPPVFQNARPRVSMSLQYEGDSIVTSTARVDKTGAFTLKMATDKAIPLFNIEANLRINRDLVRNNYVVIDKIKLQRIKNKEYANPNTEHAE